MQNRWEIYPLSYCFRCCRVTGRNSIIWIIRLANPSLCPTLAWVTVALDRKVSERFGRPTSKEKTRAQKCRFAQLGSETDFSRLVGTCNHSHILSVALVWLPETGSFWLLVLRIRPCGELWRGQQWPWIGKSVQTRPTSKFHKRHTNQQPSQSKRHPLAIRHTLTRTREPSAFESWADCAEIVWAR
jgi:hypothetical protein